MVAIAAEATIGIVKTVVVVKEGELLSVTPTEKLKFPVLVVVPLITPPGVRVNPGGRVPLTRRHTYGAVPPLTVKVCE